ncbi:hypothetical protein GOODEAATRI_034331 [Goodea atripinnis]|uniref:Uncharacterized protein n=1 Tax=Goodea atripinnis TaxID=208336 RepID=A0ABV0PJK0_9TELE
MPGWAASVLKSLPGSLEQDELPAKHKHTFTGNQPEHKKLQNPNITLNNSKEKTFYNSCSASRFIHKAKSFNNMPAQTDPSISSPFGPEFENPGFILEVILSLFIS